MPLSRREFLGSATLASLALPSIVGRGMEAHGALLRSVAGSRSPELELAWLRRGQQGAIMLDSNENPNGPGRRALAAISDAFGQAGRYPFDMVNPLYEEVAASHSVSIDSVILGCGSSEILRMAVNAFTSEDEHLVTATPTYEDPAYLAGNNGARVVSVPVDGDLRLDLQQMAANARRAGLVFVCNPNNPTGTLHSADAIRELVAGVRRASRSAMILIDEAYHEYVDDNNHASAVALVKEDPNVIVSRTFSKAFGMAGLRLGYAIANPAAIAELYNHRLAHGVNALAAAAAMATLNDRAHIESERRLNRAAREFAMRELRAIGYTVIPSQANFFMVDIRGDVGRFQSQCADVGVLVGRQFPPLLTHARISVGTMAEMQRAILAIKAVLQGSNN